MQLLALLRELPAKDRLTCRIQRLGGRGGCRAAHRARRAARRHRLSKGLNAANEEYVHGCVRAALAPAHGEVLGEVTFRVPESYESE